MGMDKTFTLRISADEEAMIEAEQERLFSDNGVKLSKAQAIRSMIYRASTVADKPNRKIKSITSSVFKEVKN
jgi:hypothetical protein